MSHTLWKIDGDEFNEHGNFVGTYIEKNDGSGRVAQTFANCGINGDEARANARLIVKAVNNRDALVAALKSSREYVSVVCLYTKKPEDLLVLESIDAALANVEQSKS